MSSCDDENKCKIISVYEDSDISKIELDIINHKLNLNNLNIKFNSYSIASFIKIGSNIYQLISKYENENIMISFTFADDYILTLITETDMDDIYLLLNKNLLSNKSEKNSIINEVINAILDLKLNEIKLSYLPIIYIDLND